MTFGLMLISLGLNAYKTLNPPTLYIVAAQLWLDVEIFDFA
jgi:hypothetical protein